MAKMIPAQIYSGNPSLGEKEIFRRLADDPSTANWIVLHSLDIADHVKNISGEADFVIIVPNKGVLCLEVKAASSVRREDGLWYYGHDNKPDRRGPFKQSSQAMHSIRNQMVSKNKTLKNVVFWSAVIFPYTQFDITSGEWHPWQAIDARQFRAKSISEIVLKVLNEARNHLVTKKAFWFHMNNSDPDAKQCDTIANILRPDFEVYEPPQSRIERLTQEVKKFTEEQFVALDAMATNSRIIFTGPAGTGKTILAIEAARRSVATGNKILFVCFNRLLSQILERELKPLITNVKVSTIHRHMLDVAQLKLDNTKSKSQTFWNEELPTKSIDILLSDTTERYLYDEIIVDEAQDLLRTEYLDFLDLSLKGGLSAGKWKLFGDFEKQAIYGSNSNINLDDAMSSRLKNIPLYNLRINCRNTPRIAAFVHLLGDLNPEYYRILRPDDGLEPSITYYLNVEDQEQKLVKIVSGLKKDGFRNQDIVVLSTRSSEKSLVQNLQGQAFKFSDFENVSKHKIRSGSIHSFKGLEGPAVVVTDIEVIDGEQATALFYVAITRALHRLYILASESVKHEVLNRTLNI